MDKENRKKLKIYISDNSAESIKALEYASKINMLLPKIDLEVVNISRVENEKPEYIIMVPAFVLDNEIIHLGKPNDEVLEKIIDSSLQDYIQRHLN